ncbi:MAG: ribonuclease D, partial [Candidatus Rokuibacteriota bacterium]
MPLPLWIRTPDELQALARELAGAGAVAIDTEADSLHHYPGKLCLVQLADARGRGHLVDPLALRDLSPLGPVLADPSTLKVLHAADNDLAYLKRRYGVAVASLFDTAVAARFLGTTSLGLEGLLTQYLGVTAVKSRQKDDWSRRPLTPEQEAYALDDVLHLIPLREKLLEALHGLGRAQWVEDECAGLAALVVPEKPADPDAYMKLKGARELDARGLAVLRELHAAREALALRLDRPPFMIVGNESLVALAARRPHDA